MRKQKEISMKLKPLGNRVVVERIAADEKTAGGIVLPDTAKEKPQQGVVMAVGDGKMLDTGERQKLQVKKGDRVLFVSYAGDEFRSGGKELLVMGEEDILAVID
jgi:chaperonin GroES